MKTVAISEFKAKCLALLAGVRASGEPLVVTRRGVPVARVLPPPTSRAAWLGRHRGDCTIVGDVVAPVVGREAWKALAE